MKRCAILCVDDDAIIGLTMKQLLKSRLQGSCTIEVVMRAPEALEVAEELRAEGYEIAVVITDWLMPSMKGDELIYEMRRRYPDVKSVLVSGHADAEAVQQLMSSDAKTAFLRKPWRNEELVEVVSQALRGYL